MGYDLGLGQRHIIQMELGVLHYRYLINFSSHQQSKNCWYNNCWYTSYIDVVL